MEDQSQLTLDRLFESVLQVCRMSHLPESLFGPVAFADLLRMSRLYLRLNFHILSICIVPIEIYGNYWQRICIFFKLSPLFLTHSNSVDNLVFSNKANGIMLIWHVTDLKVPYRWYMYCRAGPRYSYMVRSRPHSCSWIPWMLYTVG